MHRVDTVGNSPGVRRELTEGIESLPGWHKKVHHKKIETHRKIVGGSRKACRERSEDLPQKCRRLPDWREFEFHTGRARSLRWLAGGRWGRGSPCYWLGSGFGPPSILVEPFFLSPSSHWGRSTRMRVDAGSISRSSFSRGFSFRSGLSPYYNLVGLGDRPNLDSTKRARSLSSIRILKASNLAMIRSIDVIV
ncbi:hypothetical protein BHM03_00018901 [Ensete ventricosum]|nr:hypothetical protein BHM03_00018901 [Ensete ventricosum]